MTYTPINWQTGDTITADKLNKMDNGWSVSTSQLFSETVTTQGDGMIMGALTYSSIIDLPSITVTFDGTDYDCSRIDAFGDHFYGGFTTRGPDFSDFPFALQSSDNGNTVYTETAGTYAIAASAQGVEFSADFSEAIKAAVDLSTLPFRCVPNVTTYDEMRAAADAGRLLYFYTDGGDFHLVISFLDEESATAVTAYPEGAVNIETYGFIDSDMVFYVASY